MIPKLNISPAEDLLPEELEGLSWKWLGEDVSQLVLGVHSLNQKVFIQVRAEPMDLVIIELGSRSVASGLQVGQDASSLIVLMASHLEGRQVFLWNPNSLGNSLCEGSKRKDISHGGGESIVFSHHGAQRNGVLELAGPNKWTVVEANDEASSRLDRHRVSPRFLSMETHEVGVNKTIHEEMVQSCRLQDHALVLSALEILAYSDEGQLMRATRKVGEP